MPGAFPVEASAPKVIGTKLGFIMARWSIALVSFPAALASLAAKNSKDMLHGLFYHNSATFMGLVPVSHNF